LRSLFWKKNSNLERHRRTLHSLQVYTCNVCDQNYTRRYNLKAHIEKFHVLFALPSIMREKDTIGLLDSMTQKQYVPPEPLTDKLGDLVNQIRKVLRREDLHVYNKTQLYQQILRSYLNRLDLYRHRPIGLFDVNPSTSLPPQRQSPTSSGLESLQPSTLRERLSPPQHQAIGLRHQTIVSWLHRHPHLYIRTQTKKGPAVAAE
jgi:hypothetical protein